MEENKRAIEVTPQAQHKDTHISSQMRIVSQSFFERPKTMYQVEKETGICRPNICRFVRMMEEASTIQLHRRGLCPISGWSAGFYTTNPGLWDSNQSKQINKRKGGCND
ncbi:MAG: hypothetical protein ACRCY5_05405 [Phocaeicola sp.]